MELSSDKYMWAARKREAIAAQHGKLAAKNLDSSRLINKGHEPGRLLGKINASRRRADDHMNKMRLNMDIANKAREKALDKAHDENTKRSLAYGGIAQDPTKNVQHMVGDTVSKKHMNEDPLQLGAKRRGRL